VRSHDSSFAKKYAAGLKKTDYWQPVLEDSLDLCAKVYTVAARIYNNTYNGGKQGAAIDKSKDLSYNFANAIGFGDKKGFIEVIRLYNALHTDHEGGNVSAHTSRALSPGVFDFH
jgi:citrate synthase